MSLLKVIPIIGDIIEDALGIVDQKVEDVDLANTLKTDLKKTLMDKISSEWSNITSRWLSDNEHTITRLIRPCSYAYIIILFTVVSLADGNFGAFNIKSDYIGIIKTLLVTMTWAYFGSRGLEKITKIFKGGEK